MSSKQLPAEATAERFNQIDAAIKQLTTLLAPVAADLAHLRTQVQVLAQRMDAVEEKAYNTAVITGARFHRYAPSTEGGLRPPGYILGGAEPVSHPVVVPDVDPYRG